MKEEYIFIGFIFAFLLLIVIVALLNEINRHKSEKITNEAISRLQLQINKDMMDFEVNVTKALNADLKDIMDNSYSNINEIRSSLQASLNQSNETMGSIAYKLGQISYAQEQITDLSKDIMSLQSILADKKSRGTFGEVQLYSLLELGFGDNDHLYHKQYKLPNGSIADSVIEIANVGLMAIDSKFPLENYNRIYDDSLSSEAKQKAAIAFKNDCLKHIKDIANKYIIPYTTADFACMFIPAEAVYSEIYSHFDEVVAASYKNKVYLVSPTTLMAYITAIKAINLNQKKNQQAKEIEAKLGKLAEEFKRFSLRWQAVIKDYDKLENDINLLNITSDKLINQFEKINSFSGVEEESEEQTEKTN